MIEEIAKKLLWDTYKVNWGHSETVDDAGWRRIEEHYINLVKQQLLPIIRAEIQAIENPYNDFESDEAWEMAASGWKGEGFEEARTAILKLLEVE